MKPLYRRILILLILIVVLIGGYLLYQFFASSQLRGVPREFSEARARGALISQEIVVTTNEVAADIVRLNEENPATYAQASSTIIGIADKAEKIRLQAIDLTHELGIMATALPGVRSEEARLAALESISRRLDLVSSLTLYTRRLKALANALQLNLQSGVDNDEDIAQLITDINEEVQAINRLNMEANDSMDMFEALLR
jgi:hypothetical protein